MKQSLYLLITFSIFSTVWADDNSDSINKAYSELATKICDHNMSEKSKTNAELKKDNKAINLACLITAKTAISNCHPKAVEIIKDFIISADKDRAQKMITGSYTFCTDYADVVSNTLVVSIIDKSKKNKTSIEAEAQQTLLNASKKQ